MGVKHRYIDRRDWERPVERIGRALRMPDGAYAYRTDLTKLQSPAYGQLGGESRWKIADDGWCWLSWMRPDFSWALTAMRDEVRKWVQFYFDIVSEIGCDSDGRAYFEDCYLDVVVLPDGKTFLLDADELDDALRAGKVNSAQAENAHRAASELIAAFPNGVDRLCRFVQELYDAFETIGK